LIINVEKASQELRKKGVAAAVKKASRHAAEGLVGLASNPGAVAIVEINSETDFVARNDQFRNLVSSVAASALRLEHTSEDTADAKIPLTVLAGAAIIERGDNTAGAISVSDAVSDVAGSVRENIKLRRGFRLAVPSESSGVIGTYLHACVAPGLGRIASAVVIESSPAASPSTAVSSSPGGSYARDIQDLAHKLAMHVVGALPRYLDASGVPTEDLDAERAVLVEQAARSGKPEAIINKMVEGRLKKFYEEVCLLDQPFIMDDKKKVRDVVAEAGQAAGSELRLTAFTRVQVGEGLEEEGGKIDFASEVEETLRRNASS